MTETATQLLASVRANWADWGLKLIFADALDDADLHRQAALWRVLAEPHKDEHRLAFADVCEREGDGERAEFVRVQVELAREYPDEISGKRSDHLLMSAPGTYYNLRRRERELLKANFGAWTDGLPDSLVTTGCPNCSDQAPDWETGVIECRRCDCTGLIPCDDNVDFSRGFVSALTCTWSDWRTHADTIREQHPIEHVTLTTEPQLWAGAADGETMGVSDERDDVYREPVESEKAIRAYLTWRWPCTTFTLPERRQSGGVGMRLVPGQAG